MMSHHEQHYSMIRSFHFADWLTLANAASGIGAIFFSIAHIQTQATEDIYLAGFLIFVAMVFDVLDGRVARWRHESSLMGRELDSLADMISFGVAPAIVGYACGLQGIIDEALLTYFVLCGVSRLARYNITADLLADTQGKVKYFEGTPITTSLVLVIVMIGSVSGGVLQNWLWWGEYPLAGDVIHPTALWFALSGSLMISRIRIPKL
jgi:CDP-diacylglycerol--serine O-phosphatidyltransferase